MASVLSRGVTFIDLEKGDVGRRSNMPLTVYRFLDILPGWVMMSSGRSS